MQATLLLAMLGLGFQGSAAQALESETLAAEVVRLAPASWADYIERRRAVARRLQVTFVYEVRDLEGALLRKWGGASKRLGENSVSMFFTHEGKTHEEKKGKATDWSLDGVNSKYAFRLVRSDLNGPYIVSEVQLLADRSLAPRPPQSVDSGLRGPGLNIVGGYIGYRGYGWHELFTDPQCQLVLASATRNPDQSHLVTVTGRCLLQHHRELRFTATFDSSSYWLPLTWEYILDDKHREVVTQTFGYTFDGLPLLTQTHTRAEPAPGSTESYRNGPMVCAETVTYDSRLPSELDFTLSAFGLPEPYGVTWDRPTPWWLYIGGGTLAVLVIVILGYRWRRRAAEG